MRILDEFLVPVMYLRVGSGGYPMPKCFPDETSTVTTDAETAMESTITETFETSMTTVTQQPAPTTSLTISRQTRTNGTESLSNSTIGSSKPKDFPIVLIVASIVGGVALVSVIVVLLVWREPILVCLGMKRSNRVVMSSVYTSAADGAVEINVRTRNRMRPI
jgi:hypothetical protein